jgi:CDP-diacylglycerol--serine O-phosphatidyltransferase
MRLHPLRRATDRTHPRRLRKGMYVLPSLFTSGNIAAGYFAISQAVQGTPAEPWHFDMAAKAIGFAIVFDGFDGFIARMTNTASDFGRELDSLADVITFGVAPAVLAWLWGFRFLPQTLDGDLRTKLTHGGAVATFIFLVACASRLARFNITTNAVPSNPGKPGKKYFVGMPTPAAAGLIAALVHFVSGEPITVWWQAIVWATFVACAGFLMVSTWRFWSSKSLDFRSRQSFRLFIPLAALILAIVFFSQWVLFILAITYMLSGVLARFAYAARRGKRETTPLAEPESTSGTA